MTESREDKARRLADTPGRVHLHSMGHATVYGDTGKHTVIASPHGVSCTCLGWRPNRECSHVIAAKVAWGDRIQEAAAS